MKQTRTTKSNDRLRDARLSRGWSRSNLAERVGCDTKTVGRWERGESFPNYEYRQKLCKVFGKECAELGLIEELEPPQMKVEDSNGNILADKEIPFQQNGEGA